MPQPQSRLRSTLAPALLLGLSLTLASCGGTTPVDPGTGGSMTQPTVTGVSVAPTSRTLTVGETVQLSATVNGTGSPSQAVTYTSSNNNVATVNATGLVTAKAAGTATITVTSTADTTQKATVAITVNAPVVVPPAVNAQFSFRPANATTPLPAGYVADTGAPYDAARGWGWVTEATARTATPTPAPTDSTANTRERAGASVPDLQKTFIHMQIPASNTTSAGTRTPIAWEYKVANGTYKVTVSVGDANAAPNFDSIHQINVEGTAAITKFTPTASQLFATATATVTVSDGLLTVDAIGGTNTKINYVTIQNGS